jgi:hypothetical protein
MAERDTQLDREVDTDVDVDLDGLDDDFGVEIPETAVDETETEQHRGLGERARSRAGSALGTRDLAVSAVVALVGVLFLGGLFPFGLVGNLIGLLVAAFLYGTVASESKYVPMGLAGGAVGGGAAVLGNLTLTLLGPGIPLAAVGAVGGLFAGVVGHYFGRDLRDGLTREI